jgi:hypothetical protein
MFAAATRVGGSIAQQQNSFYVAMSVVCLLTALGGFGPSYFLLALKDHLPVSTSTHWHAAFMTGWLTLFVTQTALIRLGRPDLHRRVGPVAVAVFVIACWFGGLLAVQADIAVGVQDPRYTGAPPHL